jgi:hypothetical protein
MAMAVRPHFRIGWKTYFMILLWRFFTGNHSDGEPRTDAGWFRKGHKSVDPRRPIPSAWSLRPRIERAGIRWAVLLSVTLLPATGAWAWFYHHTAFLLSATLLGVSTGLLVYWRGTLVYRAHAYRRDFVVPFTQAASPILDMPASVIERDMVLEPGRVRVPIPPHYDPRSGQLEALTGLANRRLTGEWSAQLQVRKMPFYAQLVRMPEPRNSFSYVELLPHVIAGKAGNVILGIAAADEIVKADIYNIYPMVGLSMGTGAGKSVFFRSFIAQESYHGVRDFDVCDVKMVSIAGMEGVPGLRIHRTPDEIRNAVREVRSEMERRYKLLLDNPKMEFPRRYLILEEQNAFAILTSVEWKESGHKGIDSIWGDIKYLIVMARQVGIHVVGAYQLLLANVTGNDSTIRTQMSLKILSRFTPQAWDLLVGERPREKSSNHPGRAIAVMEGERKRFQIPYLTVDEAMDMVRRGKAYRDMMEEYDLASGGE